MVEGNSRIKHSRSGLEGILDIYAICMELGLYLLKQFLSRRKRGEQNQRKKERGKTIRAS
jgi:hypothetical protein